MSKKVAIQLIDSIYRGGAQVVVLNIVKLLPQYQHIVCCWTNEDDLQEELTQAGAELVRIPFKGIATFPRAYFFLKRLVEHRKPVVVHAHMFIPNMLMRLLPQRFKSISTYHGEVFNRKGFRGDVIRWMERRTVNSTDTVIAVSEHVRQYIAIVLRTDRKIEVVYNFGPSSSQTNETKEITLPLRLMTASNNQPYKDYPLLLDAFARLKADPVSVDIYGNGMAPLIERATAMGLQNVKFCGGVSDVSSYMGQYSALVMTSNSGEGFSLAVIEAMNAGLAVICSDIPQFVEAVGDDAIIFRRSDSESLVEKIRHIIRQPSQLEVIAGKAKERARNFSIERFRDRMTEIYSSHDTTR